MGSGRLPVVRGPYGITSPGIGPCGGYDVYAFLSPAPEYPGASPPFGVPDCISRIFYPTSVLVEQAAPPARGDATHGKILILPR